MDSRFLEFWGNFLLSAAKGQKQMEDMADWMKQGFKAAGFEDLAAMFTQAYGLSGSGGGSGLDAKGWQTATRQLNRSFGEYLTLMGMVPGAEHQLLKEKYAALEKKIAAREETILHLRELLGVGKTGHEETVEEFQAILENQAARFQDLLGSSTRFLQEAAASPGTKKQPE